MFKNITGSGYLLNQPYMTGEVDKILSVSPTVSITLDDSIFGLSLSLQLN